MEWGCTWRCELRRVLDGWGKWGIAWASWGCTQCLLNASPGLQKQTGKKQIYADSDDISKNRSNLMCMSLRRDVFCLLAFILCLELNICILSWCMLNHPGNQVLFICIWIHLDIQVASSVSAGCKFPQLYKQYSCMMTETGNYWLTMGRGQFHDG